MKGKRSVVVLYIVLAFCICSVSDILAQDNCEQRVLVRRLRAKVVGRCDAYFNNLLSRRVSAPQQIAEVPEGEQCVVKVRFRQKARCKSKRLSRRLRPLKKREIALYVQDESRGEEEVDILAKGVTDLRGVVQLPFSYSSADCGYRVSDHDRGKDPQRVTIRGVHDAYVRTMQSATERCFFGTGGL